MCSHIGKLYFLKYCYHLGILSFKSLYSRCILSNKAELSLVIKGAVTPCNNSKETWELTIQWCLIWLALLGSLAQRSKMSPSFVEWTMEDELDVIMISTILPSSSSRTALATSLVGPPQLLSSSPLWGEKMKGRMSRMNHWLWASASAPVNKWSGLEFSISQTLCFLCTLRFRELQMPSQFHWLNRGFWYNRAGSSTDLLTSETGENYLKKSQSCKTSGNGPLSKQQEKKQGCKRIYEPLIKKRVGSIWTPFLMTPAQPNGDSIPDAAARNTKLPFSLASSQRAFFPGRDSLQHFCVQYLLPEYLMLRLSPGLRLEARFPSPAQAQLWDSILPLCAMPWIKRKVSVSRSVISDSLWPQGL